MTNKTNLSISLFERKNKE